MTKNKRIDELAKAVFKIVDKLEQRISTLEKKQEPKKGIKWFDPSQGSTIFLKEEPKKEESKQLEFPFPEIS